MFFNSILPSAIALATIFLFGCTGEIIMEKSGHLNLGIPGIMCLGTVGGCVGVVVVDAMFSGNIPNGAWILLVLFSLIFSALFSAIGAGIYALLTVTFKCNQNVTGLALTTFGAGVTDYLMFVLTENDAKIARFSRAAKIIKLHLPFSDSLGAFGKIFLGHGIFVYIGIAIAVATAIILKKTKIGLSLRAVGENPATADAAGINVDGYKYVAILVGSIIAGFGGLFYVMDYVGGSWENAGTIQSFGWLAIALVIFCVWKPTLGIIGSILFGMLYILPYKVSGITFLGMEVLKILPYVVTVVVLVVTSIIGKKAVQPPEGLGIPYFREDR